MAESITNQTQQAHLTRSQQLFQKARHYIPGGVNSPVRAFGGVGGHPIFIRQGEGAYLIDADNRRYVDYVGSWGAAIVGHAYPAVVQAVQKAAAAGLSFGAPTEGEVELAMKICLHFPSIEEVRLVSSGTEAVMSAIRLARAVTGRDKILKFAGCYHGHADSLLVKAGSGALTFGVPNSPGVPAAIAGETYTATYNDLDSVEELFAQAGQHIAAILVEPIAGNMNCILPVPGFLQGLRDICNRYQSLLIFDEVITGFRVGLGGAQQLYGVRPDLTTLGKVIGGGMPMGAFGGKRALMEQMAPVGQVYQAGTLSGNPVAVAAGIATLTAVEKPGFFPALTAATERLVQGLEARAHDQGIDFVGQTVGGLFGLFFTKKKPLLCLEQVQECDVSQFRAFFHAMLEAGVYLAPSAFETGFMSAAHTEIEIQTTWNAAEEAFAKLT